MLYSFIYYYTPVDENMSRPMLLNNPKNVNNNITKQVTTPTIPNPINDNNRIIKLIKVIQATL